MGRKRGRKKKNVISGESEEDRKKRLARERKQKQRQKEKEQYHIINNKIQNKQPLTDIEQKLFDKKF